MEDLRNLVFDIRYLNLHLPKHTHRAYEIIMVLEGELNYFVDNRAYHLPPNSIICITANIIHQNISLNNQLYRAVMIRFSKDFIQTHSDGAEKSNFFYSFYHKTRALRLTVEQAEEARELCVSMFNEFNAKDAEYLHYCHSLLVQLLIKLKRIILMDYESSRVDYPNFLHMKVSKIASYINSHYKETILLTDMAKEFSISEYYLSRNFKTVTGFSFNEYLNTTRINMAKKLLKETGLNVTRIAEEVGFSTITHFGRTFKKIVGLPPRAFRIRSD